MASVDPRRGGPSTAVRSLASTLAGQGHEVTIVAHDDGETNIVDLPSQYEILRFPLTSKIWQFSHQYLRWVARNIKNFDAVLIHSLFLSHSFYVPALARLSGVPYAIRPHGSLNLQDMARGAFKKYLYLHAVEKRNLRNADFLFCTSEREADEARRFGDLKCHVIPLGVDAGVISSRDSNKVERNLIAFIGRLTGKKGIEVIVKSLPIIREQNPAARVIIAGPDDEGLKAGFLELAGQLGVSDMLTFPGHLNESGRNELLSKAGVFVLPSVDENFGIGVAEAMQAGVPVVITPGVSHASYVLEYGAGLVTSRAPEDFAAGVLSVLGADESRYERMSSGAQMIVREKYSWSKSAESLVQSFSTAHLPNLTE